MRGTLEGDLARLAERVRSRVPKPTSQWQATLAVAAAVLILTLVVLHSHGGSKIEPVRGKAIPAPAVTPTVTTTTTTTTPPRAAAPVRRTAVTAAGLSSAAALRGQPIYWVGAQPAITYELTQPSNGQVYLRYLPRGTALGSKRRFLTIGTYPVANAFAVTSKAAAREGTVRAPVGPGAVAFYRKTSADHVYLAFSGGDYQIEVFDPKKPGEARRFVRSGQVRAVRTGTTAAPGLASGRPQAVSELDLKVLALAYRHPIYWIGPRAGVTYELKQLGSELYLRYLPKGTAVGTVHVELTVGTYRVPKAYSVTSAAADEPGAQRITVGSGGIAFYRVYRPESVYLAYPGNDLQIEVYSPSAAEAHRLVSERRVRPVG